MKLTNDNCTVPYAFFVLFPGTGAGGNGKYLPITLRIAIYFEVISPSQNQQNDKLIILDMNK